MASPEELIVDLDAEPGLSPGIKLSAKQMRGRATGKMRISELLARLTFFLGDGQTQPESTRGVYIPNIGGYALQRQLDGKPVLRSSVIDTLLLVPDLIPEEWRKRGIRLYFWGDEFIWLDKTCIRYLTFWNGAWRQGTTFLSDITWGPDDPAALLGPPVQQ